MDAGARNDQISFERATGAPDVYGNVTTSWSALERSPGVPLVVWANIRETSGKERVAAGQVEASGTATVRALWLEVSEITAADRMIARGEVWNIRNLARVGARAEYLDILIERGVAA